jgi:hypothetical protein
MVSVLLYLSKKVEWNKIMLLANIIMKNGELYLLFIVFNIAVTSHHLHRWSKPV